MIGGSFSLPSNFCPVGKYWIVIMLRPDLFWCVVVTTGLRSCCPASVSSHPWWSGGGAGATPRHWQSRRTETSTPHSSPAPSQPCGHENSILKKKKKISNLMIPLLILIFICPVELNLWNNRRPSSCHVLICNIKCQMFIWWYETHLDIYVELVRSLVAHHSHKAGTG